MSEEDSCNGDKIKFITRTGPDIDPDECKHCNGKGEHHYHDKDGCHLKCEYCFGTGKIQPISRDLYI